MVIDYTPNPLFRWPRKFCYWLWRIWYKWIKVKLLLEQNDCVSLAGQNGPLVMIVMFAVGQDLHENCPLSLSYRAFGRDVSLLWVLVSLSTNREWNQPHREFRKIIRCYTQGVNWYTGCKQILISPGLPPCMMSQDPFPALHSSLLQMTCAPALCPALVQAPAVQAIDQESLPPRAICSMISFI